MWQSDVTWHDATPCRPADKLLALDNFFPRVGRVESKIFWPNFAPICDIHKRDSHAMNVREQLNTCIISHSVIQSLLMSVIQSAIALSAKKPPTTRWFARGSIIYLFIRQRTTCKTNNNNNGHNNRKAAIFDPARSRYCPSRDFWLVTREFAAHLDLHENTALIVRLYPWIRVRIIIFYPSSFFHLIKYIYPLLSTVTQYPLPLLWNGSHCARAVVMREWISVSCF